MDIKSSFISPASKQQQSSVLNEDDKTEYSAESHRGPSLLPPPHNHYLILIYFSLIHVLC